MGLPLKHSIRSLQMSHWNLKPRWTPQMLFVPLVSWRTPGNSAFQRECSYHFEGMICLERCFSIKIMNSDKKICWNYVLNVVYSIFSSLTARGNCSVCIVFSKQVALIIGWRKPTHQVQQVWAICPGLASECGRLHLSSTNTWGKKWHRDGEFFSYTWASILNR